MTGHGVEVNGGKAHGFLLPGGAVGHEMWYGGNKIFPMGLAEGTVLWQESQWDSKSGTVFTGSVSKYHWGAQYQGVNYNGGNSIDVGHTLSEISGGLQFEFANVAGQSGDTPLIPILANSSDMTYYNGTSTNDVGMPVVSYSGDATSVFKTGTTLTTVKVPASQLSETYSAMLLNSSDYFDENNIVYKSWGYVGNKVYVAFSGTTIKFYSSNSTVDGTQDCMLLGSIPGRGEMFFPVLSSITAY